MSRINQTLKQLVDDLDLDRRLNGLVEQAEEGYQRAVASAGEYTHEHLDEVERLLDRVSEKIEERTDGKYADRVVQVRTRLIEGAARLADRRPRDDD